MIYDAILISAAVVANEIKTFTKTSINILNIPLFRFFKVKTMISHRHLARAGIAALQIIINDAVT